MIGSNFSIAHIGKILRIPSLRWIEDDAKMVWKSAMVANPFASKILVPASCKTDRWEYKTIHYQSFHELAYLHPNRFIPDVKQISDKINTDNPYSIIRLSKLSAHHDQGKKGIDLSLSRKLIEILSKHGDVYITSEKKIEDEFEKYRLNLDPSKIHHALFFANLYIGDSQTMAAECAVLGTPSIRFNDFVGKLGYLDELEFKFGLTRGIKTSEKEKLLDVVKEYLSNPNLKEDYKIKREKMLEKKIDLSAFMVWFIENFPISNKIMMSNPDFQFQFK